MQETQLTWFRSLGWEIPWRRNWLPNPVFFPGKSHGQRSLVGYGGLRGSDTTEHAYRPVLFGLPIFFSSGKFHMKNWLLQKSPNIWQHPVPVCAATSGAKTWPGLSSLARKHWWAGWQYKVNPVPRWFSQFLWGSARLSLASPVQISTEHTFLLLPGACPWGGNSCLNLCSGTLSVSLIAKTDQFKNKISDSCLLQSLPSPKAETLGWEGFSGKPGHLGSLSLLDFPRWH